MEASCSRGTRQGSVYRDEISRWRSGGTPRPVPPGALSPSPCLRSAHERAYTPAPVAAPSSFPPGVLPYPSRLACALCASGGRSHGGRPLGAPRMCLGNAQRHAGAHRFVAWRPVQQRAVAPSMDTGPLDGDTKAAEHAPMGISRSAQNTVDVKRARPRRRNRVRGTADCSGNSLPHPASTLQAQSSAWGHSGGWRRTSTGPTRRSLLTHSHSSCARDSRLSGPASVVGPHRAAPTRVPRRRRTPAEPTLLLLGLLMCSALRPSFVASPARHSWNATTPQQPGNTTLRPRLSRPIPMK